MIIKHKYITITIGDGAIIHSYRYSLCVITTKISVGIVQPLYMLHVLNVPSLVDNLFSWSTICNMSFH